MSQRHIREPRNGGICLECEHDLIANADGYVYCTNLKCRHYSEAHPTRKSVNCPKRLLK